MIRHRPRMRRDREPHIGEYDTKTNAVGDFPPIPTTCECGRERPCRGDRGMRELGLLPVVFQHLIARPGQLGTILLQAGQDDEIALIDDLAAVALNVARTGRLLLRRAAALLLGDGTGGKRYRQQDKCQEKFLHRVPSFRQGIRIPINAWHAPGRILIAWAANRGNELTKSAGKCGQICGGPMPNAEALIVDWFSIITI
jgi:hypothetical protein